MSRKPRDTECTLGRYDASPERVPRQRQGSTHVRADDVGHEVEQEAEPRGAEDVSVDALRPQGEAQRVVQAQEVLQQEEGEAAGQAASGG